MKISIRVIYNTLLLTVIFMIIISCSKESPVKSEKQDVGFSSYQISGCNDQNLSKTSNRDSCFSYSFKDTLKIDFCVFGNCCPDLNRFITEYEIKTDTIFVTVSDIADNLCNCICGYVIHMELTNLDGKQYVFYCDYDNLIEYRESLFK